MNGQKVREFIIKYLEDVATKRDAKIGVINDSFDLVESGILDSMGFVALIASLECEFGLQLDLTDMDLEDLTVGGLARRAASPDKQADVSETLPGTHS